MTRPDGPSPDSAWLDRVRRALDRWEQEGDEPTSSITGSGAIAALEQRFAHFVGAEHALALPSGSSALRLALRLAGAAPGAEVILPGYDWPASTSAALDLGATPIYADINRQTLTVDPEKVTAAITPRTRAIVATHLFGIPADVQLLRSLADSAGLLLIEDCAQALGAQIRGRSVGTFGHFAAFSLGAGKTIDAGEGGVLVTDDREMWADAVATSQHPTRHLLAGREPTSATYSERIDPLAALVAWSGLRDLPGRLTDDQQKWALLVASVEHVAAVEPVLAPSGCRLSYRHCPAMVAPSIASELSDLRRPSAVAWENLLPAAQMASQRCREMVKHREAR